MKAKSVRNVIIVFMTVCIILSLTIVYFNSAYAYSRRLVTAIECEDVQSVASLIEKKPTCVNSYPSLIPDWLQSAMNIKTMYPLNKACQTGNIDIIKLLINAGANINCNDGLTPLSIIYRQKDDGWFEISKFLLQNGARIDYSSQYYGAHTAVLCDIVQAKPGASSEGYIPDNQDQVTLSFYNAIEKCDTNMIDWLRVLCTSTSNNRIDIVRFLLEEDYCDINAVTQGGMSPLMFAVRDASPEMVELLLVLNANTNIADNSGKTVQDYAYERGDESIILLLDNLDSIVCK